MATDFVARNRKQRRSDKVFGTLSESLPKISGENICASGGYEGVDFARTIF
jgi:hypothetical protein